MEKLKRVIHKLSNMFIDTLFPEHIKCLGCGKDLHKLNMYDVCDKCKKELEFNNGRTCARCGKNVFGQASFCFNCKNTERHFDKARAPLLYTGLTARLIKRFKYNNAPYLASTLARFLVNEYIKSDFEVDIVVPVPMNVEKERRRGYNQAELLAKEFCKLTDLPIDTEHLIKTVDTDTQTHKSREEREELDNIYKLTDRNFFKGKRVLLIDDVITTGSTLDACAKTLRASKVYGLALAHSKSRIRQAGNLSALKDKKFIKYIVN